MSIYKKCKELGLEMDNYYSDLYVKDCKELRRLLKDIFIFNNKIRYSMFISQIDNEWWFEFPFCYDPYWEKTSG